MQRQLELAYVDLQLADPASVAPFFADVVGLVPGEDTADGHTTWRNDDKVHRVIVEPGPANDALAVGFEAVDETAFDAAMNRLHVAGFSPVDGTDEARVARRVDRLIRATAPWGIDVEIVLGLADASAPYSSPLMPGGFLTRGVGFGHVVFATTAFDESHAFLVDALGLSQSDWLETEVAGIELEVRFYHCNERHHSVALARAPFELPQKLHHIMFETNSRDDVGAAFDRAWSTELLIPNGLGRHPNDGMFSFYVASPAGLQVEIGHGARVITDGWDDNRRYDRISAWGHQPLRQA